MYDYKYCSGKEKIMRFLKKFFKIFGIISLLLFIGLYVMFYVFTKPKTDKKVLEKFKKSSIKPIISYKKYKDFEYRQLSVGKDSTKLTIVFVHGTIGSCLDFKEYMKDSLLLLKANMISYDRIGYNYKDKNDVQESIAFERDLLLDLTKKIDKKNTILVGYSYGGPIVLAVKEKVKKVILLAPAVYSKIEPMPWMLNLYKWKSTRWLVPPIWKQASKEKLSHRKDLENFENNWNENPNQIVSIQGNKDWIVPYENSIYLKEQFPENQFELRTLKNAGHGLVWSHFEEIKQELLKQLD